MHPSTIAFILIYALQSVDDCNSEVRYPVNAAGEVTAVEDGAWQPHEPELHTDGVSVSRTDADGRNEVALIELTGDQHRNLEERGRTQDFIARLARGEDARAALEAVDCA